MIRISVIDTNIDTGHPVFSNSKLHIEQGATLIANEVNGHGTAVCGIIAKEVADAEITLYPIFPNGEDGVDAELLIDTLHCIYDKNDCDIINLSCGLIMMEKVDELYAICNKLRKSGIWIVSAFENTGLMSYPACFDNVIGVDQGKEVNNIKEFIWIENSPINIVGYALQHRVPWVNGTYLLVRGTSYVVPYITSIIASLLTEKKLDIYRSLSLLSCKTLYNQTSSINKPDFAINRAIIFPFCKEIHALIRFSHRVSFKIDNFFDVKYFHNIGRKPEDILNICDQGFDVVKCFTNINWEDDFDTVIIAHVDHIQMFMERLDMEAFIVSALKHRKNIYTFDKSVYDIAINYKDALHSASKVYFPFVDIKCLEYSHQGRFWMHATPIIGIFGTSSKQGKYTLQICLDELLKQRGYTTGLLSTEPNGWLMGMDAVYNFGYGNSISLSEKECIVLLNQILHYIEKEKTPDVIIAASQSGTIPYNNYIPSCISIAQTAFLHGLTPDAVILCINMDDDISYIERTISHIEAYVNTKVVCIVVYPFVNNIKYGSFAIKKKVVDITLYDALRTQVAKSFSGAIVFAHDLEFSEVANVIVDYLADE